LFNVPWFHAYFVAALYRFAVCGKNPAGISRFVATMRPGQIRVPTLMRRLCRQAE
jgi:hypothetical protein